MNTGSITINGVVYDLTATARAVPEAGVPAARAAAFTAIVGINTHLGWTGAYADIPRAIGALKLLGVHLARDSCTDAATIAVWQQVKTAIPALRFADYMPEGSPDLCRQALALVPQLAAAGLLAYVEGCNEPDDTYAASQGMTLAWAAQFQAAVLAAARAAKVPCINLSFGSGWTADNNWQGDYAAAGDLSAACDRANAHTYPQHGDPPASDVVRFTGLAKLAASARPVIHTEFGYEQTEVPEDVRAKYLLCAIADAWKADDRGLWCYALYDDHDGQSGPFGLFNDDGSPRASATAIANLLARLADPGPQTFTPTALAYQLAGCESVLLQKSDGGWWIVAWAEQTLAAGANPAKACMLTLPTARALRVFDPITGGAAMLTMTAPSIVLSIPAYPVLIAI